MARKPVMHEQDYVVEDGQVRVSVIVGERQFGSSIVFLDNEQVANGDVQDFAVGNGGKLGGRTISIYTLVTDVRDNTDEMSVTWVLVGGNHRVTATAIGSPAKKFGSQMFKGVFHLTSA